MNPVSPDSEEWEIGRMMFYFPHKMERVFSILISELCSELGLKEHHIPILKEIYYNDGISQKGISVLSPRDKSRVSVIVNELIRMGYLRDSGKGRTSCLHLTDSGTELISEIDVGLRKIREIIFGTVPPANLKMIMETMVLVDESLDCLLAEYTQDNH